MLNSETMSRLGGIVSMVGVALFVVFVTALLVFPVGKECATTTGACKYVSEAPDSVKPIVMPGFLAISLMLISAGIVLVRLGRRAVGKKTETGSS